MLEELTLYRTALKSQLTSKTSSQQRTLSANGVENHKICKVAMKRYRNEIVCNCTACGETVYNRLITRSFHVFPLYTGEKRILIPGTIAISRTWVNCGDGGDDSSCNLGNIEKCLKTPSERMV